MSISIYKKLFKPSKRLTLYKYNTDMYGSPDFKNLLIGRKKA